MRAMQSTSSVASTYINPVSLTEDRRTPGMRIDFCSAGLVLHRGGGMVAALHGGCETFGRGLQRLVDLDALLIVVLRHHGIRSHYGDPQRDETCNHHNGGAGN